MLVYLYIIFVMAGDIIKYQYRLYELLIYPMSANIAKETNSQSYCKTKM